MRIFLVVCSVIMLVCTMAHAADSITFDFGGTPKVLPLNTVEKIMYTRMLTRDNARRAANSPPLPAQTLEEFVAALFIDMTRGYKVQSGGLDVVDACVKFNDPGTTAAQRNQILTILGGNSPCPQ
jgi:hypothetical protein